MFLFAFSTNAQVRIYTDYPYLNRNECLLLDVYYSTDTLFKGDLFISLFKFHGSNDSTLVLKKNLLDVVYKRGTRKMKVDFGLIDTHTFLHNKFYEVLKRTGNNPPGSYKMQLTIRKANKTIKCETYIMEIDSILKPNSQIRSSINNACTPKSKSFLGVRINKPVSNAKGGVALANGKNKINKMAEKNGLRTEQFQKKDMTVIDLYFEDWFAGRYEIENSKPLWDQVKQTEKKASTSIANIASIEPGSPALFSQYKFHNNGKNEKEEISGNLSLTTHNANSQEPNSGVNTNYYEITGMTEMPIMGIPMIAEGYYTSQDKGRSIKSSYFRLHYDVSKAKNELFKSIKSYNSKYSSSGSKLTGSELIYNTAISKLESQKMQIINNAKNKAKKKPDSTDLSGIEHGRLDTINDIDNEQIKEIDRKVEKYKGLLSQQKNAVYFDSALVYKKTKNIKSPDDIGYKKMVQKGNTMLPDGKAKKIVSGITALDIGMFSNNESKYTMSGQMIKGGNLGYDLSACETQLILGQTEFVGRGGSIDKYTCYATKASFKVFENQKVGIIYYGYSPSRQLYASDAFFQKINISSPTFFEPTHILAATYVGNITKYLSIEGESATSYKNGTNKENAILTPQKMAYCLSADARIPNTPISLGVVYDRVGLKFENNTLPLSMAGTQQYKVFGRTEFFRSLFSVGVEFNRRIQENYTNGGVSTKWGFDAKTNFKRYPNAAISYKPFTTFHYYSDTMLIPQHPLFGSVTTAKLSYNMKRTSQFWRFSLLYSENRTVADTTAYANTNLQAMVTFSNKKLIQTATMSQMEVSGTTVLQQSNPSKTKTFSMSTSYTINKQFTLSGGGDIGFANFGLCRLGVNSVITYRPSKIPMTLRLAVRYNSLLQRENDPKRNIYGGTIEIAYRFKAKVK